jgi:hypothetical protein
MLRDRLLDALGDIGQRAGRRLVVFATEDSGLRCLNEFAADILKIAEFPRARALPWGGLDKAELFDFLSRSPASIYMPPTEVLHGIDEAEAVLARLGPDAIFKPALKPLDMDLGSMGDAKVVTRRSPDESIAHVLARLRSAFPISSKWVAQARLHPYPDGERGVWVVRGPQSMDTIEFVERWKYPAQGGTGCWVETVPGTSFVGAASAILEAVDYVGLAELPFLRNDAGQSRLLEINARAWLQVGLAERSGLRVIGKTIEHLSGESIGVSNSSYTLRPSLWINVERAALAAATGISGYRIGATCSLLWTSITSSRELAIYSSPVRGVKRRWFTRLMHAGWRRLIERFR